MDDVFEEYDFCADCQLYDDCDVWGCEEGVEVVELA